MEVKYGIYDDFTGELWDTRSVEVFPVSEWREGLCICVDKIDEKHMAFLISKDKKVIYYQHSNERHPWEGKSFCIERIFGGDYAVYEQRASYNTFPGKDRETERYPYKFISRIITNKGVVLSYEESRKYVENNEIKLCRELGNGIILCENSTYKLMDYSHISSLPKESIVHEEFNNNRYEVSILRDYCNLIVVVLNHKIIHYFKENDIKDLLNIFSTSLPKIEKIKRNNIPPENTPIKDGNVNYVELIKDYYYKINPKLNAPITNFPSLFTDVRYLCQYFDYTGFYFENNEWFHVNLNDVQITVNQMIEKHYPVRNFITGIVHESQIKYKNRNLEIYRFECKPKGYIDINGIFHYNFDINNIHWY